MDKPPRMGQGSAYWLMLLGILLLSPAAFFALIYGAAIFAAPGMGFLVLAGLGLFIWGAIRAARSKPNA